MPHFIHPDEHDRCVFLSYEGDMPPLELSAARYEASGALARLHWKRLVVDVTQLHSKPTPGQLYDHAKAMSSDVPRGARVALLVRPEQVPSARLVEQVARKGHLFLTYFLDPDKAMAWVKQITRPTQTTGRNRKAQL
jgi:hypothetical protein